MRSGSLVAFWANLMSATQRSEDRELVAQDPFTTSVPAPAFVAPPYRRDLSNAYPLAGVNWGSEREPEKKERRTF